ncbi:MAG: Unknown protein [uncultured Sulfurovum sp.]|uniref:Uncharacterized protein n=1 Tax=uncultured Sulfurovum sp. TaxID=269237 RepID=A0A6S6SYH1_9BACT|nr:MAG: Unknown protein [uncultured Sulfurovum sp.]
MTELIVKMTSWLIAAMLLGFIVAWLLSRIVYWRKHKREEDSLSAIILERNNMIEKLEKTIRNQKIMSEKVSDDLEDMEKAYANKTSELTTLQSRLANVDNNKTESLELRERNSSLLLEVKKLKDIDSKRLKELQGFEEVLVKSEDKLQENEREYKNLLRNLDKNVELLKEENKSHVEAKKFNEKKIAELEESLKLYKASSNEAEFIISKDQFVKIEEQLAAYQKEIMSLNNEKEDLEKKLKKSSLAEHSTEENLENKAIDALKKESDDGSMVKVFRETYKKITKS